MEEKSRLPEMESARGWGTWRNNMIRVITRTKNSKEVSKTAKWSQGERFGQRKHLDQRLQNRRELAVSRGEQDQSGCNGVSVRHAGEPLAEKARVRGGRSGVLGHGGPGRTLPFTKSEARTFRASCSFF